LRTTVYFSLPVSHKLFSLVVIYFLLFIISITFQPCLILTPENYLPDALWNEKPATEIIARILESIYVDSF